MSALLEVRGLVKRFGGLVATDHLDLDVRSGEIHALIGPNGAGKTTVINQLFGDFPPDEGSMTFDGRALLGLSTASRVRRGLGRTFQITRLLPDYTALEHLLLAIQAHAGHSFRFFRPARSDAALVEPAMAALARVDLADRADVRVSALSHGERKELELAIALALEPKLLLLDEPMAGLGASETEQMVRLLESLRGQVTMLLVEHDMEAVFALADRITVLVYGRAIASGTAADIQANPEVKIAYLGEGDA
jgi:branched-chain amino acid transport system ATP-binding protein